MAATDAAIAIMRRGIAADPPHKSL